MFRLIHPTIACKSHFLAGVQDFILGIQDKSWTPLLKKNLLKKNYNRRKKIIMAIKRIEIQNFKSFRHQAIELGQFNVLIGANASGKSNFLQIFKFISDIARHGLNNAISIQGGVEYLRNINIAAQENLAVKIVIDSNYFQG